MKQVRSELDILGLPPCLRGFLYWSSAIVVSVSAWHLYLLAPMPGLALVGVTPFVNLFLFFRGFSQMTRTIPYIKTVRAARRLHLEPSWGCRDAGFFLVDEARKIWIANGITGSFDECSGVGCRTDGQAFRLELFTDSLETPRVSIGMGSDAHLSSIAEKLRQAVEKNTGRRLPEVACKQD